MAFAAATSGYWLATIVMPRLHGGSMFALPVLFIGALLSLTGVLQQQIPAYFLALLALLPIFGKISLAIEPRSYFGRTLVAILILLPIGVAATTTPLWPLAMAPAATPTATETSTSPAAATSTATSAPAPETPAPVPAPETTAPVPAASAGGASETAPAAAESPAAPSQ
jgi:hypothetical protein